MESSKEEKKASQFEEKLNKWVTDHLTRVPFAQKTLFVHHLQIMIKSGLSIVNALQILSDEIENKKLQVLIADVKKEVETGKQLSEALGKFPTVFPPIYVSMIAAGETSGKLEQSLVQIHEQMKKSQELTSRIRGALIYPAIVLVAMVGIAIEVVVFVLPKLMVMFKEFDAQLPLATRILIKITDFGQMIFTTYVGIIVLALAIGLWFLGKKIYSMHNVKRFIHLVYLKIPIFGSVIQKISLARFTLTLSSLLESAIPIIDAVKITSDVLGNIRYKETL
ncbi:type II secretion system F family protein, partial [Patescibacteria group bacterium]|nr:type II secretion system F family protein [Patescibacteria group bacterium]